MENSRGSHFSWQPSHSIWICAIFSAMFYNYSDYAQFGIKNATERHFYGGWCFFVVICSLIGDSAILIASIKYKAFNLHKIVVAFIQHVAVCDLMNAALSILPTTVSIFCNSGGSSKILNYVRFFILYYVNCLSACLIAALSLGGEWQIFDKNSINTSFPSFLEKIDQLGGNLK